MKMKKKPLVALVTVLMIALVVLLPFVVMASGGGGGEAHEEGGLLKPFIYQLINFAVLVGLLVFFAKKPVVQMFKDRTAAIQKGIEEASRAREAAVKALKEIEDQMAGRDAELKALLESAKTSGERERQRLMEEGERMSRKILEQAKTGIEFELKQASDTLKAEAAGYALELAEQKLKADLTPDAQKKLYDEALKRLEDRS